MYGVVLHAHPVRGESHNQRNTTGEVATLASLNFMVSLSEYVTTNVTAKPATQNELWLYCCLSHVQL